MSENIENILIGSKQILVVEDDPGLRNLIVKSLSKEGFIVQEAATGAEAIDIISADPEKVMLMDQNLPDMKGQNIIENLINNDIKPNFIVMTGHGDEKLAVEMMKLGAADYLVKELGFIRLLPGLLNRVIQNIDTRKRLQAAEKALSETEYRFRLLAEVAPVGIIISNYKEQTIYVSTKFTDIYGYDLNDFSNVEEWFVLAYPDELIRNTAREEWNTLMQKIQGSGTEIEPVEYPVRCKDGKIRQTEFRIASSKGLNFIVLTDITQRKIAEEELKKSEEKYRLIFEKSPLGVLHFDNKGHITDCNDHFVRILGSTRENLIGMNLLKLKDYRIVEVIKKVISGHSTSFEGVFQSEISQKNTPIKLLLSPVLGANGMVEAGVGIMEDITAQIEKEEYQKQVVIANESVKFKQNFLANMSHEIRTPLTGLMGMIEILDQTALNTTQQEYVNILKTSGENLKEIINQVLDFSKIEAGKMLLKPHIFEFTSLLDNAAKLFSSLCDKEVSFETSYANEIPRYILADRNRVTQVINNLISNAIKFTEKGKISLRATLESIEGAELTIKIEINDTGRGISDEKQKSLFIPFAEIHENDVRIYEGSGLGLSICKELTLLMGGRIGVASREGYGSKFWFTFKAQRAEPGQSTEKIFNARHIPPEKKLRILLAEDKVINQRVIKLILTSMGHSVTVASNGREVIEIFKPGLFDLILMDIQMPVMDGITATKKLKEHNAVLPPIVGLSANAFEGDREKYMAQGMDEYLTKPIVGNDFKRMVLRMFG
jgi:PAS domain S-box-containing protein